VTVTFSHSTTIDVSYSTTAGNLKDWLMSIPDSAKISTTHIPGDRPFDPSMDRITARWTEKK